MALLLILAACSQATAPSGGLQTEATPGVSKAISAEQSTWNSLVAAAKKEGTVVIYANMAPKARDDITATFNARYGIKVEWLVGRPAEVMAKIKAERAAGLYLVDAGFAGSTTFTNDLKPMGISEDLEPMLILPEVKDPKSWRGGQFPFLEKTGTAFILVMFPALFYLRNTDLVQEKEVTISLDLLDSKFKERIVMSDPGISGSSNNWFTWTLSSVLGKEKGLQFMKDLVGQKPVITRDERQLTEWVARGKFHIGIGPSMSIPGDFIQMGAPLAWVDVNELRLLSAGFGIINVYKNAPHPNAAKVFLNWILSKEGSSIFARGTQYPSIRVDVPPEGILPVMVPRPDDIYPEWKYGNYATLQGEMRPVAAEIFGVLYK